MMERITIGYVIPVATTSILYGGAMLGDAFCSYSAPILLLFCSRPCGGFIFALGAVVGAGVCVLDASGRLVSWAVARSSPNFSPTPFLRLGRWWARGSVCWTRQVG